MKNTQDTTNTQLSTDLSENKTSHDSEHSTVAEASHTVAHVLSAAEKGQHLMGKHIHGSLGNIVKGAEVIAEVICNNSDDPIERVVCGTLAASAKIVAGTAVVGAVIIAGEVEAPLLVEAAMTMGLGQAAQTLVDAVITPVGDTVENVCRSTFVAIKGASSSHQKVSNISSKSKLSPEPAYENPSIFSKASDVLRNLEPVLPPIEPCIKPIQHFQAHLWTQQATSNRFESLLDRQRALNNVSYQMSKSSADFLAPKYTYNSLAEKTSSIFALSWLSSPASATNYFAEMKGYFQKRLLAQRIKDAQFDRRTNFANPSDLYHHIWRNMGYTTSFDYGDFKSALRSTGLESSYNGLVGYPRVSRLGRLFGQIGGVATKFGIIDGLENSVEQVLLETPKFLFKMTDGDMPFSFGELQQVMRELAYGIFRPDASFPFFSLHFNHDATMYPVIPKEYENTLVGNIIAKLDFWMKSFLHGGTYSSEFLDAWPEDANTDPTFLKQNLIDIRRYCKQHNLDFDFHSLRELQYLLGLDLGENYDPDNIRANNVKGMKYQSSFRIIVKQNSFKKDANSSVFLIDADFDVLYDMELSSEYKEEIEAYKKQHGEYPKDYLLTLALYEKVAKSIHDDMPKLPFCKTYFQQLKVISFLCYYFNTLKSMGMAPLLPPIAKAIEERVPKLFPHVPVRYFKVYPVKLAFGDLLQLSEQKVFLSWLSTRINGEKTPLPQGIKQSLVAFIESRIRQQIPETAELDDPHRFAKAVDGLTEGAEQLLTHIVTAQRKMLKGVLNRLHGDWSLKTDAYTDQTLLQDDIEKLKVSLQQKTTELTKLIKQDPLRALTEVEYAPSFSKDYPLLLTNYHDSLSLQLWISELKELSEQHAYQPIVIKQNNKIMLFGYTSTGWILTQLNETLFKEMTFPTVSVPKDKKAVTINSEGISSEIYTDIANKKAHSPLRAAWLGAIESDCKRAIDEALLKIEQDTQKDMEAEVTRAAIESAKDIKHTVARLKREKDTYIQSETEEIKKHCTAQAQEVIGEATSIKNEHMQELDKLPWYYKDPAKDKVNQAYQAQVAEIQSHFDARTAEIIAQFTEEETTRIDAQILALPQKLQDEHAKCVADFKQKNQASLDKKRAEIKASQAKIIEEATKERIVQGLTALNALRQEELTRLQKVIDDCSLQLKDASTLHEMGVEIRFAHSSLEIADSTYYQKNPSAGYLVGGCSVRLPNQSLKEVHLNFSDRAVFDSPPNQLKKVQVDNQDYACFELPIDNKPVLSQLDVASFATTLIRDDVKMISDQDMQALYGEEVDFNPAAENPDGQILAHFTAHLNDMDGLRRCIQGNTDYLLHRDHFGRTVLHEAAASNAVDAINYCLEHRPELLEIQTTRGATALTIAAEKGNDDALRCLVNYGANVNHVMPNGLFPLYLAFQNENYTTAHALIEEAGERLHLDQTVDSGSSSLHLAVGLKQTDIALLMIARGAKSHLTRFADGYNALHVAVEEGLIDVVKALLNQSNNALSVHAVLPNGKTVLHLAVENHHFVMTRMLIEQFNASVDAVSLDNTSVLAIALKNFDLDLARYLVKKVKPKTDVVQQGLWLAASLNQWSICDMLLERGADPVKVNEDGHSLIFYLLMAGQSKRYLRLVKQFNMSFDLEFNGTSTKAIVAKQGHLDLLYDICGQSTFKTEHACDVMIHTEIPDPTTLDKLKHPSNQAYVRVKKDKVDQLFFIDQFKKIVKFIEMTLAQLVEFDKELKIDQLTVKQPYRTLSGHDPREYDNIHRLTGYKYKILSTPDEFNLALLQADDIGWYHTALRLFQEMHHREAETTIHQKLAYQAARAGAINCLKKALSHLTALQLANAYQGCHVLEGALISGKIEIIQCVLNHAPASIHELLNRDLHDVAVEVVIRYGHVHLLSYLKNHGADIAIASAFQMVLNRYDAKMFKELLRLVPEEQWLPDIVERLFAPFMGWSDSTLYAELRAVFKKACDWSKVSNESKLKALYGLSSPNDIGEAEYLLQKGVELNCAIQQWSTSLAENVLNVAVAWDKPEFVALLIRYGADPSLSWLGRNAVEMAVYCRSEQVLRLFEKLPETKSLLAQSWQPDFTLSQWQLWDHLKRELLEALLTEDQQAFAEKIKAFPLRDRRDTETKMDEMRQVLRCTLFEKNGKKQPLVHWAFELGAEWALEILKDQGRRGRYLEVDDENGAKSTLFHKWAMQPNERAIEWRDRMKRYFLPDEHYSMGAQLLNAKDSDGDTPLKLLLNHKKLFLLKDLREFDETTTYHPKTPEGNGFVHAAVLYNSIEFLEFLFERHFDLNMRNKSRQTPLMFAAATGHLSLVKWLVSHHADVNAVDIEGNSALHIALIAKKQDVALYLHSLMRDVHLSNRDGNTPFMLAAAHGQALILMVLNRGPERYQFNLAGQNALHLAAMAGQVAVIRRLVESGFAIDEPTRKVERHTDWTAIQLTAQCNQMEAFQLLIQLGASPIKENADKVCALEYAVAIHNESFSRAAFSILVDRVPDRESVIWKSVVVKLWFGLIESDCAAGMRELLLNGFLINTCHPDNGYNALHYAAVYHASNSAHLLISGGIDCHALGRDGNTPLHLAAQHNALTIVQRLTAAEVDLNIQNREEKTALHLATERGYFTIVLQLLKMGADVNLQDEQQATALHVSCLHQFFEIANLLVIFGDRSFSPQFTQKLPEKFIAVFKKEQTRVDEWHHGVSELKALEQTSLHLAVRFFSPPAIRHFAKRDPASVNQPDKLGHTPGDIANEKQPKAASLLRQLGSKACL